MLLIELACFSCVLCGTTTTTTAVVGCWLLLLSLSLAHVRLHSLNFFSPHFQSYRFSPSGVQFKKSSVKNIPSLDFNKTRRRNRNFRSLGWRIVIFSPNLARLLLLLSLNGFVDFGDIFLKLPLRIYWKKHCVNSYLKLNTNFKLSTIIK